MSFLCSNAAVIAVAAVASLMASLKETGRDEVSLEVKERIAAEFSGGFCDDEELAMMPDYADSEHEWARLRPKVTPILKERKKIVAALLTENKAALKSVAEELVRHGTLFQEDVVAILRRKTNLIGKKKERRARQ